MSVTNYQAHPGKMFPIKTEEKIVYITDQEPVAIDTEKAPYLTKVHLLRGVQDKDIFIVEDKKKKASNGQGDK